MIWWFFIVVWIVFIFVFKSITHSFLLIFRSLLYYILFSDRLFHEYINTKRSLMWSLPLHWIQNQHFMLSGLVYRCLHLQTIVNIINKNQIHTYIIQMCQHSTILDTNDAFFSSSKWFSMRFSESKGNFSNSFQAQICLLKYVLNSISKLHCFFFV